MNPAQICKLVYDQGEQLTKKGHNCVVYLESYPVQLSWCHNTLKCDKLTLKEQTKEEKEDIIKKDKLNKSIQAFSENIKSQGHKCVSLINTIPYVEWCQQKICVCENI